MNNKYQVFFLVSVLLICFGCASKPFFIELQDKNYYDKVHSIGIYLNPSGHKEYDEILFNSLSLRCITSGYDVINMSLSPDKSNPFDRNYAIGGSHQKQIKKIKSYLLSNKINASNLDAVYVVTSKWKRFSQFLINKKTGELYEAERQALTLSVTTLDVSAATIVASSTISDSTELYLDDETANRFKGGEDVSEFRYYPTPLYVLIQKCIDRTLGINPASKLVDTIRVKYQFPVTFYVDQKYRKVFHTNWKERLQLRLLYVSDIYDKQFDIGFYIRDFKEWYTIGVQSPEQLLKDLMTLTSNERDQFIIGVTFDTTLAKNWIGYHALGSSMAFGNHLVIKDIPSFEEVFGWDAIQEALVITHELGHSFGAPHIFDPTSVMYPSAGRMSYHFDSFNHKIIQLIIPQKLKPITTETYYSNIDSLIRLFNKSKQKNIELISLLSEILSKDYLLYTDLEFDVLNQNNFQLSDSSIFHSVNGYKYYERGEWRNALEEFEKAIRLDLRIPEIYVYCAEIYEKLNDQKKSEHYRELAEEMGVKFIGKYKH